MFNLSYAMYSFCSIPDTLVSLLFNRRSSIIQQIGIFPPPSRFFLSANDFFSHSLCVFLFFINIHQCFLFLIVSSFNCSKLLCFSDRFGKSCTLSFLFVLHLFFSLGFFFFFCSSLMCK